LTRVKENGQWRLADAGAEEMKAKEDRMASHHGKWSEYDGDGLRQ